MCSSFSKVVCICTLNKFSYNGFAVADAWNKEKIHRNSCHVKLAGKTQRAVPNSVTRNWIQTFRECQIQTLDNFRMTFWFDSKFSKKPMQKCYEFLL